MNLNKNIATFLKTREIDENIKKRLQRKFHVTDEFLQRLGLERELEGHQGCVNCLEWDSEGRILASASDDFHVILWDPFRYRKLHTIETIHQGNIFTVKFLPYSNGNTLVTGAGDNQIHTIDITRKEPTHICECPGGRVKRLATTPHHPTLFWSASEDGVIRQYDVRTPHTCSADVNNIIIYLRTHLGGLAEAKCLATNPMQPELLAVGANDPYIRLYDRRMISFAKVVSPDVTFSRQRAHFTIRNRPGDPSFHVENNLSKDCVQYFVAGHLSHKYMNYRNLAATYLTFCSRGKDLLVNLGSEQIYIFDITSKQKISIYDIPVLEEQLGSLDDYNNAYHNGSNSSYVPTDPKNNDKKKLPENIEAMKLTANMLFEKENYCQAIRIYNEAIKKYSCSPVLYSNRAAAYMKRNWIGDMYAAFRDCVTTLELDPNHAKAFFRLTRCLKELECIEAAKLCLETFKQRFPSFTNSHAYQALELDIKKFCILSSEADPDENEEFGAWLKDVTNRCSSLEWMWRDSSYDYDQRFYGHCNTTTDIKEANFFGSDSQYIVAGSDDGSLYLWDRATTNNLRILRGDSSIVNCLQPHPTSCLLATSGIDPVVRLWTPRPENEKNVREVEDRDSAALSNQRRMKADPFDVVMMSMSESEEPPRYNCRTS